MRGIHGPIQPLVASQTNVPPQRLVAAAHEFEAQMMKELLKPMSGGGTLERGPDEEDRPGSAGVLGEFASEMLGHAISEAGGLGIAHSILESLSRCGNHSNFAQGNGKGLENRILSNTE